MQPYRAVSIGFFAFTLSAFSAGAQSPASPTALSDLSALDPAVAAQIREVTRALETVRGDTSRGVAERAAAQGDLARLFHAYELEGAAEAAYRAALELTPGDGALHHLLGALLQKAGRLDEAEEQLYLALNVRRLPIDASAAPTLFRLGEIALAKGQAARARFYLERTRDLVPNTPATEVALGQLALAERRYAEAVTYLEAALAHAPAASRLHHPLGLAYRGLGEDAKAKEHLAARGEVGVKPRDPLMTEVEELRTGARFEILRGRLAFQAGQLEEARLAFERALAAEPGNVSARVNLGSTLLGLGRREEAIAALELALRSNPDNVTGHFNLGVLRRQDGDLKSARDHFEAAAASGRDAEASIQLGEVLVALGSIEEALPHFRQAASVAPTSEPAYLGGLDALVRLGRYAEARGIAETALAQLPDSGLLSAALARLLAASPDLGQRDGARALTLAQSVWAARGAPSDAETVALALAELGRCVEAADWQKRATELARAAKLDQDADRFAQGISRYTSGANCRPPGSTPAPPPAPP